MGIDTRVAQYVKLRDLIKEQDDAHKEKMKPFREALEQLNSLMLLHLQNSGAESVSTTAGTVYTTAKKTASIADGDAFMKHVIATEAWELLDRKANVKAVEDFISENGVLPPGLKFTSTNVVGVRRA